MKSAAILSELVSLMLLLTFLYQHCEGHGRLLEPPSRASMWRLGYNTPHNYDDNQLFCGGVSVQYAQNGGKCGVCGDPWSGPREHEAGGRYHTGTIVRSYSVGQVIDVLVELTANHQGYFEFHICPSDNPFNNVTHDCLDKHPLALADTGDIRYQIKGDGYNLKIPLKLRLPGNIKCRACVLQWKYNAGNSWGVGPDGQGCVGCGNQEQFYGCADVTIGHSDVILGQAAPKHPWYFQDGKSDWHYGIVKTTLANNTRNTGTKQVQGHAYVSLVISLISLLFVTFALEINF